MVYPARKPHPINTNPWIITRGEFAGSESEGNGGNTSSWAADPVDGSSSPPPPPLPPPPEEEETRVWSSLSSSSREHATAAMVSWSDAVCFLLEEKNKKERGKKRRERSRGIYRGRRGINSRRGPTGQWAWAELGCVYAATFSEGEKKMRPLFRVCGWWAPPVREASTSGTAMVARVSRAR